jgi:hypothetical protein
MRARRARAEEKYIVQGKAACRAFRDRLAQCGLYGGEADGGVAKWFEAMDSSGFSRSDGTLTLRELRIGLANTKERTGVTLLKNDELMHFVRHIDKSGESDLSLSEVQVAIDGLDQLSEVRSNNDVTHT